MPDFGAIIKRVQELFAKLTMVQKMILGGILLTIVLAMVFLASFSTRSSSSMLFQSPMAPEDYARITKKLTEWNVKFDTKDDKYILVKDADQSKTVRMRLAQDGFVPSSIKGWELFDTQKFTTTDFERNVNLQRAIIGEMVKHIKTLDDIEDVSIDVAFPKDSLYTENQGETTASIVITAKPYSDIADNKTKVKGIVNLVALGVPNLKKENIVVVDNHGNVLSDLLVPDEASDTLKVAREHLKIKEKERAQLIARIKDSLKESIDPSRVIVSADIEFDWTKKTTHADKIVPIVVKPDNPLTPYDDSDIRLGTAVSEKKTTEKFDGPAYVPEGAAGVENNVPPGLKDKIDRFTHYNKDENIVNYDNSKEKVEEEKAPYEIKRVSVAVSIDGVWEILRNQSGDPIVTNGGKIAREYHTVDSDSLKNYEAWVKGAINFDLARGDTVVVNTISFDHSKEFDKEDEGIRRKVQLRRTLFASIIVLFFLFLATLAYRAISRELERRRRLREEEIARQQQAMREAALRAAEEEAATVELSIEEKARAELLENAVNMSRERPEEVARLIRTWLAEE